MDCVCCQSPTQGGNMPCDMASSLLPAPPAYPGEKTCPGSMKGMLTCMDPFSLTLHDPFLGQTGQEDLNLNLSLAMELIEEEESGGVEETVSSLLEAYGSDGADLVDSSDADSLVDDVLVRSPDSDLDITTQGLANFIMSSVHPSNTQDKPILPSQTQFLPIKACPSYEQATAARMNQIQHSPSPSTSPTTVSLSIQSSSSPSPAATEQAGASSYVATHPTMSSLLSCRPLLPPVMTWQLLDPPSTVPQEQQAVTVDLTEMVEESESEAAPLETVEMAPIQNTEIPEITSEEATSPMVVVPEEEQMKEVKINEEEDPVIPLVALEAAGMVTSIKTEIKEEVEEEEDDEEVKEELMKTQLRSRTPQPSTALRFPALVASLQAKPALPPTFPFTQVKQEPCQLPTCVPQISTPAPSNNSCVNTKPKATSRPQRSSRKRSHSSSDESDDESWEEDSNSPHEDNRLQRRRLNNRVAAQRCRQRKREYFQGLKKEIQTWECQNTSLRYEIHTLEKELQQLMSVLSNHECKRTGNTSSALLEVSSSANPLPQLQTQATQEEEEEADEGVVFIQEENTDRKKKSKSNKHRHDKKRRKKSKHRG